MLISPKLKYLFYIFVYLSIYMDQYIDTQDSWIKYSLCLLFVFPQGKKSTFSILEIRNFTKTRHMLKFYLREDKVWTQVF